MGSVQPVGCTASALGESLHASSRGRWRKTQARSPVRSQWGPAVPLSSFPPAGSLSSEDHDFDPAAETLVQGYDEDGALEEEEVVMDGGKDFSSEIEDLEKVQGVTLTSSKGF